MGFVQETKTTANKTGQPAGFEWLKQFEGTWTTISKSPDAGDQPAFTQQATMKSRSVGEHWIINEYSGLASGMNFEAIQTVGYDSEKKQFTGSWIDSLLSHTWHYTGSLDETGMKLTLEAEGPDWTDPGKSRRYRDIYEFRSENEIAAISQMMNDQGAWETFMTGTMTKAAGPETGREPRTTVTPFLMFAGEAEAAINFYKTVFPDTQVESMTKYEAGENGKEGTVKLATIVIAGQHIKLIDSPVKPDFGFTPAFSFFVECENEAQLKERFGQLSGGGKVMMPPGDYGFSQQFGWATDRFGVNWQLNLK
jgi:predicted 3-demethylubiquinone-9 3-methyltransferase (glyoxalase superfamily)